MTSQQVESLKTIPVPTPESTHGNITEEELNQAPRDFLKNIMTQRNHQQHQVNDQINDPNFFYNISGNNIAVRNQQSLE